jgi:hypothetical protein
MTYLLMMSLFNRFPQFAFVGGAGDAGDTSRTLIKVVVSVNRLSTIVAGHCVAIRAHHFVALRTVRRIPKSRLYKKHTPISLMNAGIDPK